DLRTHQRLAIRDNRERLQRRLRKTPRPILLPDQRFDPGRVLRLADKLPRLRDANEPIAPLRLLVLLREYRQRVGDRIRRHLLEQARRWLLTLLRGLSEQVAQGLCAQRLLRGKQNGF